MTMTKYFLLNKTLVQKIARATNALLILQWAHDNTLSKQWNATDPDRCGSSQGLKYWIMIVVKDDEPYSSIELMNIAERICKGHCALSVNIFRKKDALRKLKNNHGDFALVYRLGYALYNADKKSFPQPGYARNDKKQLPVKPIRAAW